MPFEEPLLEEEPEPEEEEEPLPEDEEEEPEPEEDEEPEPEEEEEPEPEEEEEPLPEELDEPEPEDDEEPLPEELDDPEPDPEEDDDEDEASSASAKSNASAVVFFTTRACEPGAATEEAKNEASAETTRRRKTILVPSQERNFSPLSLFFDPPPFSLHDEQSMKSLSDSMQEVWRSIQTQDPEKGFLQFVRALEHDLAESLDIYCFIFSIRAFLCWHKMEKVMQSHDACQRIRSVWIQQERDFQTEWLTSRSDDENDSKTLKWSKWTFQAKNSILDEIEKSGGKWVLSPYISA